MSPFACQPMVQPSAAARPQRAVHGTGTQAIQMQSRTFAFANAHSGLRELPEEYR
jgi:hypothetical protein